MPKVVAGQYCGHVTLSIFEKQMGALAERDFTIITHRELMRWLYGNEPFPNGKVAAIDFDDNRLNVLQNAVPVMAQYGFKGTVFVISQLADGRLEDMQMFEAMGWDHVGYLMDIGWIIGAHTASHPCLTWWAHRPDGYDRIEQELIQCDQILDGAC